MFVNIPEEYLKSERVHNGFSFEYNDQIYNSRFDVINKIIWEGGNVIDLGCVGYIPNISKAIENNVYLHAILTDKCGNVLGVDIDSDGINYVKDLGYNNVIKADIIRDSDTIKGWFGDEKVDFMVMGEMLHEIDDPIGFLSQIRQNYTGFIRQIVITVPNIYRYSNIINGLSGKDINHTENRCWFSPYTLCKTIACSGIRPKEIYLAGRLKGKKGFLLGLFKKNICAEHIVLVGEI